MAKNIEKRVKDLAIVVGGMVGDDGTGDLGVIIRHALAENPRVTARAVAAMVREAREEWAAERALENSEVV